MKLFLICSVLYNLMATASGCANITWDYGGWANEIGWGIAEIESCFPLDTTHNQEDCCVDGSEAIYTITCTDSWGDGWNGHVLTVGGLVVCDDSTQGDWEDEWTMEFSCSDDGNGITCGVPDPDMVVPLEGAVVTFSVEEPLSETAQDSVVDAYCLQVSTTSGISLDSLECTIEESTGRRRLLTFSYTCNAFTTFAQASDSTPLEESFAAETEAAAVVVVATVVQQEAAEEAAAIEAAQQAEEDAKGGGGAIVAVIIVLIVLAAGAGGAYYYLNFVKDASGDLSQQEDTEMDSSSAAV